MGNTPGSIFRLFLIGIVFISMLGGNVTAGTQIERVYKKAYLMQRKEDLLTIQADHKGKTKIVTLRLTDQTKVLDEKGARLPLEAIVPGGIWRVILLFPQGQEGIPNALELRRAAPPSAE